MNIEYGFDRAKFELVCAEEFVKNLNYDAALVSVGQSWSNLRILIDEICKLKSSAALAAIPPGEPKTMNIENHVENSKKALDLGRERIATGDFDTAIQLFASASSDVRELINHAWRMKHGAALDASPPGENVE